ncbi:MAG: cyclase family protein [Prosthecobacter sp.]
MKRTWKDISVPLRDSMVQWPGDPVCRIERVRKMEQGDMCNLTHLSMSVHTGTHMDAPRHFLPDGITMEKMPMEPVIGRCRVIEFEVEDQITADDLKKLRLLSGQRLLFKTRNSARSWTMKEFDKDFISIRSDAAQVLADLKIMTVGVDYMSIGGYGKDVVETHQIMLGAGIWVIEGLNLAEIKPGYYDLICLPVKIEGADGAPCRAVLR